MLTRRLAAEPWIARSMVMLWLGLLLLGLGLPLASLFSRALMTREGGFAGLGQIADVLSTPGLTGALGNSLLLAFTVSLLVVPLAFGFAWSLLHARVPGARVMRYLALSPLLAPSLMAAISLVYLFGNQGPFKSLVGGEGGLYGYPGLIVGEFFYTFPHALLILLTGLGASDGRLYDAARAMGAGAWRQFATITLPAARYALVSAFLVVFTLVITDYGVPKVVGGNVSVLAIEVYKQVVGQQNFERGAVVGLMLLLPALLASLAERVMASRQRATLTARSEPYRPAAAPLRDVFATGFVMLVALLLVALLGVGVVASFIRYWPYDLTLTIAHYGFEDVDGGWAAFANSLKMAGATALTGAVLVFLGACWSERLSVAEPARRLLRLMAMLSMAVPGLVLGIGYVFFFNHPANPLSFLYGGMALMVVCTVAHFYTTAHLTVVTALHQVDREFEAVAASLKVPFWVTVRRVTLPVCLPTIIDVARYFFVSAMTTVSALVFIVSPKVPLAAVSIIVMDDAGDTAAAAAMASLVVATSALVTVLFAALEWLLGRRLSRWRA
ncbi:putative 2-aminoethylphosphonate ABC transporter permease subunit [Paludibacterium paludis]|uniref:ABC transporter permease n=1 Tax=Paludibacterium paludis TaxID=1225769 RepID=A0A918NXF4_9NEIS|nr:putative 2-aminoethylphosphonate ABC transporter permease subunit [Paludibacterium paludis]GGY04124.1 ABC transporter permease [Paludibacterium paludis]